MNGFRSFKLGNIANITLYVLFSIVEKETFREVQINNRNNRVNSKGQNKHILNWIQK